MNRSLKLSLFLLVPVVLAGAFLGRGYFSEADRNMGPENTVQTQTPRDNRLLVRAARIEPESFSNRIFTTGTVLASEEVNLRSETSGRITRLNIREGMPVRRGDVLVKINDADLQAELMRTRLQLELAEIRETRQMALLENRAIAREDYEVALNQVNTLKAEVDLIQARIDKTEIRAPFDGTIGLRNVSSGAYITPSDIVATLQDYSTVRIDFSIPERHAALVVNGDRIIFTRQGSQNSYEGRIMAIEPRIDATTRTLQLRAVAPNRDTGIFPGSFVEIELQLAEIPDAILVPTEAVIPELGGHSMFVYRSGVADRVRVTTGVRTETRVQITEGLVPGDTILTTGILQLRENLPVRLTFND
jgi:membrane fusion protein, multidrug efflux system